MHQYILTHRLPTLSSDLPITKLHLPKSIYYRFFQLISSSHNGIQNVRRFAINMWALLMCDYGIVGSYIYNKIGVTLTILP